MTGLGLVLTLVPGPGRAADGPPATPFQIALTSEMFTDVNEADARAAVKAWATGAARERGLEISVQPKIFAKLDELDQALEDGTVDAAAITAPQYFALGGKARWGTLFAAMVGGDPTTSYVLLVHRDSGITKLSDLSGRRLVIHQNPMMCLAEPWLQTLLGQAGLPPMSEFLGTVSTSPKLSRAVLPVFFRQMDACVVSQTGFDTMVELNPQVGRNLRVLATSPEFQSTVFCFRADYDSPVTGDVVAALRDLHLSAAGRQVLNVFKADRLVEIPPAALDGARELLMAARSEGGNGKGHASAGGGVGGERPSRRQP